MEGQISQFNQIYINDLYLKKRKFNFKTDAVICLVNRNYQNRHKNYILKFKLFRKSTRNIIHTPIECNTLDSNLDR